MPRSYNSPAMDELRANVTAAKARIEGSVDSVSDAPRGLGALASDAIEQAKPKEVNRESLAAKIQTMAEQVYNNVEDLTKRQTLVANFVAQFEITTNDRGENVIYNSTAEGRDTTLTLSDWNISGTLSIPAELQIDTLEIDNNMITSLLELPSGLTELWCYSNQLSILPELPEGVTDIWCSHNQLSVLPDLPDGLTGLSCGDNQLSVLPELPSGLTKLICDVNRLSNLPVLPENLMELSCHSNQLKSMPKLPERLTELYCHGNKLPTLPKLPSGLTELTCDDNQLSVLPELPSGLTGLSYFNNPLNQATLDMIKSRGF